MKALSHDEWLASLPENAQAFIRQLAALPLFPLELAKYAQALVKADRKRKALAGEIAERARMLAPRDVRVWAVTEWHYKEHVRRWHFSLLHDHRRNDAYREALRRNVRPGMTVLEIGTGSGIIAMFAAQAGAAHVYTCEMEPLVAVAARVNIARNGFSDRITVIEKKSTDLQIGADLPGPPDVLVSEIVDNRVLGEDVLPVMEDAWARLLKPETIVLPDRVESRGALVGGLPWTKNMRTPKCFGLDLSAMDLLAPAVSTINNPEIASLDGAFSDDFTICRFDFAAPRSYAIEEDLLEVKARRDGLVDGVVKWLWLGFGEGVEFTNRPPCDSAWHPQMYAFPETRKVKAGEVVALQVGHDRKQIMVRPA